MRVVAAVITKDDQILICRRGPHKSLSGFWEFPGGKVEARETDGQALVREIREELQVEIQVQELICTSRTSSGNVQIEMHTYSAELLSATPSTSSDHDELRWVNRSQLLEFKWPPLDIPVVHALTKFA